MATFGDLVVRLGLDKTRFDRGIGGMRGGLSSLKSAALPAAAAITAIGGAATAAALAFKAWMQPVFESLDRLGDLSSRLGVSTELLGGLQYAATLAGIEHESLTTAITKYLDTQSNAVTGTKTAIAAFSALGLKADDLKNLALDQQFVAVADALQRIQNPADRVRIAIDLFGKSGSQMLQLLNDGSKNLIATLEEAKQLGIAPSNEEIARIQAANDALDRMAAAWDGIGNTIAISVAPAIQGLLVHVGVLADGIQALMKGEAFDVFASLKRNVKPLIAHIRAEALKAGGFEKLKPPALELVGPAPGKPGSDPFSKGKAFDSIGGAKDFGSRMTGTVRDNVAPGGIKGSAEALGRILRAGSASKDPVVKAVKDETTVIKGMAKDIKKLATGGMGGGLIVGAAGAGV